MSSVLSRRRLRVHDVRPAARGRGAADARRGGDFRVWNDKFRKNVRRDERHETLWLDEGWHVAVLWTCGLVPAKRDKTLAWLAKKLASWSLRGAAKPRRRTARSRRSAAR